MSLHTSFRVGGPADLYVEPLSVEECIETIRLARECSLPWIVLGAGSNILVADEGIDGVVIATVMMGGISIAGTSLTAEAGATVEALVEASCQAGLGGLEFLSGMPGSVGGAVWMNARCYGSEVSEVLEQVTYLDESLELRTLAVTRVTGEGVNGIQGQAYSVTASPEAPPTGDIIRIQEQGVGHPVEHSSSKGFEYKKSPFQGKRWMILDASFRLSPKDPHFLEERIQQYRQDREKKGHYLAPSAGSVFKNDRTFGEPAGVILDRLGFKGFRIGDAEVSPLHANIIVNRGAARARDIRTLVERMQEAVQKAYGRTLEPEILFMGRWAS